MKSIIQDKRECWVCHTTHGLHLHHCFFGVKNRTISDINGFTCHLCLQHHEGTNGVHGKNGHELDLKLKRLCQEKYEEDHTREDFIRLIGKSYILD